MRTLSFVAFLCSAGIVAAADDFKPEPGFTLLFNGKNLDGWQEQTAKKEPLDGKTEAFKGRFTVKDGELVIDPSVKGDVKIETKQEFGKSVIIRFEFKPDEKCNNDFFLLGTKFDITLAAVKQAKKDAWNELEIVAKDGKVEFKCNGELVRSVPTKVDKSTFAIRAEFGAIAIRKLRASDK
jgi:3-keto-disaccharide hydrolase